jgi:hypothetical protein
LAGGTAVIKEAAPAPGSPGVESSSRLETKNFLAGNGVGLADRRARMARNNGDACNDAEELFLWSRADLRDLGRWFDEWDEVSIGDGRRLIAI